MPRAWSAEGVQEFYSGSVEGGMEKGDGIEFIAITVYMHIFIGCERER